MFSKSELGITYLIKKTKTKTNNNKQTNNNNKQTNKTKQKQSKQNKKLISRWYLIWIRVEKLYSCKKRKKQMNKMATDMENYEVSNEK